MAFSVKQLFSDIQAHPVVVALVVFVLLFIVYQSRKSSATQETAASIGASTLPRTSETYAQQYNQYPTYTGSPVIQQNPPQPTPSPPLQPYPGSTFLGPTGVTHFVATGQSTLAQIAQQLGIVRPSTAWNSIQKLNGQPGTYVPPRGTVLTI